MVQRTSNGYPFTVLAAVPSIRTGIRVEIYDKDDPSTLIDVLPNTRNRKWVDPLNDSGAGEFEIHEDDDKLAANPTILEPGNIIRFYLDGIPRFAARIERRHYIPASQDEDSARWIKVSGRGALAQLEDGAIYPQGGLTGAADRDVTGLTPAAAFLDFYAEAVTRGSIVDVVTPDFTDDLDTLNQPYNFTLDETVRAGRDDLLTIIRRWADMGVDVNMAPDLSLELYANGLGVDKTIQTQDVAPVIFRRGHNVRDIEVDEDLIIKNTLLIETPAGFFERSDPASATEHGRREGYLSLGNTTSGDYIDRATNAAFAKLANVRTAITAEVLDIDSHRPYVDGGKGDWVFAPDAHGNLQRFRILGITVSEDDNGIPIFVPTLNEETAELESRLQKWLRTMTPGTLGGEVSETTAPNTATTSEAQTAADDAVDTHESAFLHADEIGDLTDVDVTGIVDDDIIRYDQASADFLPEALNLDALDDVTTAGGSTGDVLTQQADGSYAPATPSGGGGGGGPEWVAYLAGRQGGEVAHADDLFFATGVPGAPGAGTAVLDSGSATWLEGRQLLSVHVAGTSAGDSAYRIYPLTPSSTPVTIEAAVRLLNQGTSTLGHFVGLGFTDGTSVGSNHASVAIRNQSNTPSLYEMAGTLTANGTDVLNQIDSLNQTIRDWLYIRIIWTAANTFAIQISPDGVTWLDLGAGTFAKTITPTNLAVWATDNGEGDDVIATFAYVRVYEADLT